MLHAGTGMIAKMLAAPLRTHDMSDVVELHPELRAGDVLVADRGFCSYAHLALLWQRGVQGLLRIHQRTIVDFTPGRAHVHPAQGTSDRKKGMPRSRWLQQLGATDQLVRWLKPLSKPVWISAEQYAATPASLVVRELRYAIRQKGFRPKEITLVTTLLDAERYPLDDLAELFLQRWEVELDLRSIKIAMQMDILRCKTPELVRKEIWTHVLAYNLIRTVMAQAASQHELQPREISFKGTVQTLEAFQPLVNFQGHRGTTFRQFLYLQLLEAVATHRVADRPDRFEPRKRKRNPRKSEMMTIPRRELKRLMRKGVTDI